LGQPQHYDGVKSVDAIPISLLDYKCIILNFIVFVNKNERKKSLKIPKG
jgi:hypothetical protein